ncbi:hypothetical protein [Methanosarcina sp.]|uniref:hypothetical protein n=1 Tax=Methanosarcina sp. TaxID=2213 RepID=UPI00298900B6|nr:hypothetical protein [Methanosarcina sp.]MDW5552015.1 hypothetical protein [Methanosarcina sp.]MDW5555802.1 hypothetical protein [Methanosarcina sp.]MDW5561324.1 hypothetical protein [Methanosarcina sp.]
MRKKPQASISFFLEFVSVSCAILSLTNFKLDISTFFNSLDAFGKIYLVLIVGSMLVVPSFFYTRGTLESLEHNITTLNSNLKINTTEVENRIKEKISELELNFNELEHDTVELKERIIRTDTIVENLKEGVENLKEGVENLKEGERNIINKLIEKL